MLHIHMFSISPYPGMSPLFSFSKLSIHSSKDTVHQILHKTNKTLLITSRHMCTHGLNPLSPGFPNASANYFAHIPACTEVTGLKGNSSARMFIL